MQFELCRVDFINNYLTDYGIIKTTKLIFLKKEKKPQLGHAGSSACGGLALSFLLILSTSTGKSLFCSSNIFGTRHQT